MRALIYDIKYAIRQLRKNPSFTIVAVLTLALGIGACTAMFSLVNAVLLQPLPLPDSGRLVQLLAVRKQGEVSMRLSYPNFIDCRAQSRCFEDMAAYRYQSRDLVLADGAEHLWGASVSQGFFPLLGMNVAQGRTFLVGEDQPNANPVVILSHGLWKRRFAKDRNILGKTILLGDSGYTVVGVLPVDFPCHLFDDSDFWTPLTERDGRKSCNYNVIGRLRSDVPFSQAQTEINTIGARIAEKYPEFGSHYGMAGAEIQKLSESISGRSRIYMLVLLGAVAFVLLIACVNVANLVLARVTSREKEIVVRRALGANWFQLLRSLMTETLLLALLGGVIGLCVASWSIHVLQVQLAGVLLRSEEIGIDFMVLGFTMLLTLGSGIFFCFVPMLRMRCAPSPVTLTERKSSSAIKNRFSQAMIVAQISAAMILLMGATLMIRTFYNLMTVDPGFNPDKLFSFHITLPSSRYQSNSQRLAFCDQVRQHLTSTPGIKAVSMDCTMPFGRVGGFSNLSILGRSKDEGRDQWAEFHYVLLNYFQTMDIPVRQGCYFNDRDSTGSRKVIINERFAKIVWPNESPVGQLIIRGGRNRDNKDIAYEVIGVVANNMQNVLGEKAEPEIYFLYPAGDRDKLGFVVRTTIEPALLFTAVRDVIRELDPVLPIQNLGTLREHMTETISRQRCSLIFLGLFAVLSLILVLIGIYGVISYVVTQRTNEFGIRMALGALPRQVVALILKKGAVLAGIGIIIGLGIALILTRFMSSFLYGVNSTDPITYLVVSTFVIVISLLACVVPARRAAKVDPMEALRYE